VTSVGPVYLFRNVYNRSQFLESALSNPDADDRQVFFKSGSDAALGNGRRYVFHNTMLQMTQAGESYGLGAGAGIGGTGSTQPINNTWSKNNIYHLWKPNGVAYQYGSDNVFAYDLYNGTPGEAVYTGGMQGTPVYAAGSGPASGAGGMYQLAATSPGYGRGTRIPNFNDGAAAPDVGAHQSGTTAMKFGLSGSPGSAVGGGTTTTPPPPAPPTTPTGGITVSPGALTFGTTLAAQTVTVTNTTTATVTFGKGVLSSTKYGQKSACTQVAPGASCTVQVTYYPVNAGSTSATLTFTSNAPNSPHVVTLTAGGTVTAPPPPPSTGGSTYALTVTRNGSGTVTSPSGISCGTTCTANIAANTAVTLTATPAAGNAFKGWYGGGCSGRGTCTTTMGSARTITAYFYKL
jgi:hypothetical protein